MSEVILALVLLGLAAGAVPLMRGVHEIVYAIVAVRGGRLDRLILGAGPTLLTRGRVELRAFPIWATARTTGVGLGATLLAALLGLVSMCLTLSAFTLAGMLAGVPRQDTADGGVTPHATSELASRDAADSVVPAAGTHPLYAEMQIAAARRPERRSLRRWRSRGLRGDPEPRKGQDDGRKTLAGRRGESEDEERSRTRAAPRPQPPGAEGALSSSQSLLVSPLKGRKTIVAAMAIATAITTDQEVSAADPEPRKGGDHLWPRQDNPSSRGAAPC